MISDQSASWVNGGDGFPTVQERDFEDDEANPLMTDATADSDVDIDTAVFITSVTATGTNVNNAILVVNDAIDSDNSATYYLSADNGSNWESVTPNEIHRFTNNGTNLKVKIAIDRSTDPDGTDDIYEYAVLYSMGAGTA